MWLLCPGVATRRCGLDGAWETPDVSGCESLGFRTVRLSVSTSVCVCARTHVHMFVCKLNACDCMDMWSTYFHAPSSPNAPMQTLESNSALASSPAVQERGSEQVEVQPAQLAVVSSNTVFLSMATESPDRPLFPQDLNTTVTFLSVVSRWDVISCRNFFLFLSSLHSFSPAPFV